MTKTTYVVRSFAPRLRIEVEGHEDLELTEDVDVVVWQLFVMARLDVELIVDTSSTTGFVQVERGREYDLLKFLSSESKCMDAHPLRESAPYLIGGVVYDPTDVGVMGFLSALETRVENLQYTIRRAQGSYSLAAETAVDVAAREIRSLKNVLTAFARMYDLSKKG